MWWLITLAGYLNRFTANPYHHQTDGLDLNLITLFRRSSFYRTRNGRIGKRMSFVENEGDSEYKRNKKNRSKVSVYRCRL